MTEIPHGTIASISDQRIATFYNRDGDIIGELDFSGKNITFEGSVQDSANSLFMILRQAINPLFKEGE